jgi:ABC-type branched-subunit amino acid transport system substrate-binding protein
MNRNFGYLRKAALAVAAMTASALVLSGCSGQAGSEGSGNTIKVFLSYAGENAINSHPQTLLGAEAAVKAINANGGVKGRQIELVACDNRFEAQQALVCARQGSAKDIVAWVGQDDIQSDQSLPLLAAAGIPSVGLFSYSNPADFTSSASFPITAGATASNLGIPHVLEQLGVKRVMSQACEYPACGILAEQISTFGPEFGLDVAPESLEVPNAGLPDYSPAVQKTKGTGPEAVVQILSGGTSIALIKAARDIGFEPLYAGNPQAITEKEAAQNGELLEGYLTPAAFPSPRAHADWPIMQKYIQDRGAHAGVTGEEWIADAVLDTSWNNDINAWLSVYALAKAVELIPGDDVTAKTLTDTLNASNTSIDLFGFQTWTPGVAGPAGYERMPQMVSYFNEIKGGKIAAMDLAPFDLVPMLNKNSK